MLQKIKELLGNKLVALDGDIGQVKDFYFDDKSWVIRYLIADTGNWLTGRLVLISPHTFGKLDRSEKNLHVKLQKKQIEESPSIDSHIPVSRQYEIAYYRHYGLPVYWDGVGLWGVGSYPMILPSLEENGTVQKKYQHRGDKHLQSVEAVTGYDIQTADESIGHVSGFMVDDKSWAIQELVIETGSWFSGKEILISTDNVERISYEESKVFVNLTMEDIQQTEENEISLHIH